MDTVGIGLLWQQKISTAVHLHQRRRGLATGVDQTDPQRKDAELFPGKRDGMTLSRLLGTGSQ